MRVLPEPTQRLIRWILDSRDVAAAQRLLGWRAPILRSAARGEPLLEGIARQIEIRIARWRHEKKISDAVLRLILA